MRKMGQNFLISHRFLLKNFDLSLEFGKKRIQKDKVH
jgi:hypothetical protein